MIELTAERRQGLQPLFADYPYLHGLVCGIVSGAYGQAFADRDVNPTVAMLCDDGFVFFAGEAASPTATEMLESRSRGDTLVPATDAWRASMHHVWGDRLRSKERIAFTPPGTWNRQKLRQQMNGLPAGMVLKQIMPADAGRFAALAKSLVEIDPVTEEASLGEGIGYGVECDGTFLSGCSGFPAGGMVEFEVQTHPSHRRRGLGTVVAAALVEHCIAHDLTPCWDAANHMSAGLALKLGFIHPNRYNVYRII